MNTNKTFPILDYDDIPESEENDVCDLNVYNLINSQLKQTLVDLFFGTRTNLYTKPRPKDTEARTCLMNCIQQYGQTNTLNLWLGIDHKCTGMGLWLPGEGDEAEDALCFIQTTIPAMEYEIKKVFYFLKHPDKVDHIRLANIFNRNISGVLPTYNGLDITLDYNINMIGTFSVLELLRR